MSRIFFIRSEINLAARLINSPDTGWSIDASACLNLFSGYRSFWLVKLGLEIENILQRELQQMTFWLLNLSRRHKTSIILLWLTPDDFTRQGESSRLERVKRTEIWRRSPFRSYVINLTNMKLSEWWLSCCCCCCWWWWRWWWWR